MCSCLRDLFIQCFLKVTLNAEESRFHAKFPCLKFERRNWGKNVHSCIIIFLFQGNVLIMFIVLLVLRSNNIIFYQFIGDIV